MRFKLLHYVSLALFYLSKWSRAWRLRISVAEAVSLRGTAITLNRLNKEVWR